MLILAIRRTLKARKKQVSRICALATPFVLRSTLCKPIIYTGEKFYNEFLGEAFNDCMLNVAKYTADGLRVNRKWQLWQFSECGKVSGIKGPVDLNALDDRIKIEDIMLPEKD